MNLNSLLPFRKSPQLLVCETDGFSLRGAVLTRAGNQLAVLHEARTEKADMAEALADVLAQLKADGWIGGGPAVLLSPAVLSMLVELPVNPKKPRPLQQMLELVHWEVEPLLMQHMTLWSIGRLLVAQDYMTEEQASVVMDLQRGKPQPVGGLSLSDNFLSRRFGELAEELGYIKRSQLNACLSSQEWLKGDGEKIECGWAAQGPVADVPGTFNWLIGCVNQSLLQRWAALFARHGVKLKAMYPVTGCSAELLPESAESGVVLEPHRGMGFAIRLVGDQLTGQHQYLNLHKSALEICLESYHALHVSRSEQLWLANRQLMPGLADELSHVLEIEVNVLSDAALSEVVTPGMAGAALQALGISDKNRCVGVRPDGPLPPFPQRLEVRAAALALALLTGIAAAEVSLLVRKNTVDSRKQDVDARWQSLDEANKRINAQIEQIQQRKLALEQQKAEQQRYEALLDFYGNAVPARVALVQGILGVLQNAVSDEVAIVGLDEPDKPLKTPSTVLPTLDMSRDKRIEVEHFRLDAWAMNEAAAQSFIQTMTNTMAPWQMEVRDAKVSAGKGPLNVDGFAVSMHLVKLVEPDGVAPRQSKPG